MTTKKSIFCLGVVVQFALLSIVANAQSVLNTYPTGAEGIRPGTTAHPGHYTRSYNLWYFADDVRGPSGQSVDPNFEVFSYLSALRHFWITDVEIFGADYGMDLALPIVHRDIQFSTPSGVTSRSSTGYGDTLFQPVLLGWHGDNWDIGGLYGMFIPTGRFDADDPSSVGSGHWTHILGLGGTWYPDAEKTWSVSLANRIELHGHNDDLNIDPGAHYSVEWGVAKKLADFWEVAAVGTYTTKIEDDAGPGVLYDPATRDRVSSAGVEVTKFFPDTKLHASVRWFHEFEAQARPEGDAIWFSLARIW